MFSFSDAIKNTCNVSFPVGEGSDGELVTANMKDISHLLVAGATGTGKSVFLNTMTLSLIKNNTPECVRFILCDTKLVEFCEYNNTSHLLIPVVSSVDKIDGVLEWVCHEIDKRLSVFATARKKSISDYNDYAWEMFSPEFPRIIIVLDDFSSAITARRNIAESIKQIILKGRASGVHLVLCTQTPTFRQSKQISLLLRSKVLFSVTTASESRMLLGNTGAETLGPFGEAMFSNNGAKPQRVATIMATEDERNQILNGIKDVAQYSEDTLSYIESSGNKKENTEATKEIDELLYVAGDVVMETGQASVSMLQRRLKLGYGRAARLLDELEEIGVVGPFAGSAPRIVLVTSEQWNTLKEFTGQTKFE